MIAGGLLTIPAAASRLSISESSVRRLVARGAIAVHRFGGCIRIDAADLDAFVARCRKPPVTYLPAARRIAPGTLAAMTRRQVAR